MLFEAVGEEHAVWVDLNRPVVPLVLAVLLDIPPDGLEDVGVDDGGPRAFLCFVCVPGPENRGRIAREDAGPLFRGEVFQLLLVGAGKHGHEAVERGAPGLLWCHGRDSVLGPCSTDDFASPAVKLGDVLVCAVRLDFVLPHAALALVAAELVHGAGLPRPRATQGVRRALAELLAGPVLGPADPGLAVVGARRPVRVLVHRVAPHARLCAAPREEAVLAGSRARPRILQRRPLPELRAAPGAALVADRPACRPILVLFVALVPLRRATPRLGAVLVLPRAAGLLLLGRAVCHDEDRLHGSSISRLLRRLLLLRLRLLIPHSKGSPVHLLHDTLPLSLLEGQAPRGLVPYQ
mmetsp:Transcript_3950/g.10616  ORF Transcript_3950/g.10616 Transcript_3950/m.10616 type:complete len:351 (+) Transcript_3950:417-1469(+)